MIEWRFVIPVLEPLKWSAPTDLGTFRRINVVVYHRWVPFSTDPVCSEGHGLLMEWQGPDDETIKAASTFVTQEAFEHGGPWMFWCQHVGDENMVCLSVVEPDKDMGDNPLDIAAFRVSLMRSGNNKASHMRRSKSTDGYRFSPVRKPQPADIEAEIHRLLQIPRETT